MSGSMDEYVEGARRLLRRRQEERDAVADARCHDLRRSAQRAADVLVEQFGARRVILFGSVAAGRVDHLSDLDLAVEGLAPERYFPALGALADVVPGEVDLVPLEEAVPSLKRHIIETGTVLRGS